MVARVARWHLIYLMVKYWKHASRVMCVFQYNTHTEDSYNAFSIVCSWVPSHDLSCPQLEGANDMLTEEFLIILPNYSGHANTHSALWHSFLRCSLEVFTVAFSLGCNLFHAYQRLEKSPQVGYHRKNSTFPWPQTMCLEQQDYRQCFGFLRSRQLRDWMRVFLGYH